MGDESKPVPSERQSGVLASIQAACSTGRDVLQSIIVMAASLFAIAAYANPPWAHDQLRRLGIDIKEINVMGVRLVVNQTFTLNEQLAEAQSSLATARTALAAGGRAADPAAAGALDAAMRRVQTAQAALDRQEQGTRQLQKGVGQQPDLPEFAWITVGYLTEGKKLQPAARIDAGGTKIANDQVQAVVLSQPAIVRTDEQCTRTEIANVQAPSAEELQKVVLLLRQGTYEAVETHACGSIGNGQMLSARIKLSPDRVKLAKFADAKG